MTLREFIENKHGDERDRDMYVTLVMIKMIEKMEIEVAEGVYNSYTPENITLTNFSIHNPDRTKVRLVSEIRAQYSQEEGVYLPPEVLAGNLQVRKSPVFTLGTILDELIHGSTYFKTVADV